jgi:toxin YoeB
MEIGERHWELLFKPKALADRDALKKSGNKPLMRKIQQLLEELELHPETGTGKPEKLVADLAEYWSRRINSKHRLIYKIHENSVEVYSMSGHYSDK